MMSLRIFELRGPTQCSWWRPLLWNCLLYPLSRTLSRRSSMTCSMLWLPTMHLKNVRHVNTILTTVYLKGLDVILMEIVIWTFQLSVCVCVSQLSVQKNVQQRCLVVKTCARYCRMLGMMFISSTDSPGREATLTPSLHSISTWALMTSCSSLLYLNKVSSVNNWAVSLALRLKCLQLMEVWLSLPSLARHKEKVRLKGFVKQHENICAK